MKRYLPALLLIFSLNSCNAIDLGGVKPINPLEGNSATLKPQLVIPSFELKRATLSTNAVKNQYAIAMNKFMQSNVQSSYMDFKILIDNITPNDYAYMRLSKEMAAIGFFNLSELAMAKIQDDEICYLINEDVKNYYFPSSKLTQKDQLYLAEIYSNIMYNDQSREATDELTKQSTMLMESDYANYLAAFGSMKNGNTKQAKKYINDAISKNPKNINYRRLKAEILAQSEDSKEALKSLQDFNSREIQTVVFDKELHSSEQYILYKSAKNDYWKKYHLAYYYYDKGEYNKALGVLQTSISGKKNINKEVYALNAKVYFELKEFEKAQDYAQKAVDIDSSHSQALIILGDIASRNKDYNAAQKYYKKASSSDGTHAASIKLAQVYQEINNTQKAKEIYSKILKVSSKAYIAYYNMALLEPDRQTAYIKKSLAINPEFVDGWLDLARIAIRKDEYDNANTMLTVAKYIDDNNYRYYYYSGLVLKNKGLSADASKNFEKCLELNPEYDLAKKELSI